MGGWPKGIQRGVQREWYLGNIARINLWNVIISFELGIKNTFHFIWCKIVWSPALKLITKLFGQFFRFSSEWELLTTASVRFRSAGHRWWSGLVSSDGQMMRRSDCAGTLQIVFWGLHYREMWQLNSNYSMAPLTGKENIAVEATTTAFKLIS